MKQHSQKLLHYLALPVLAYPALLACIRIAYQLFLEAPSNPWVAALVVDGWRSSVGLPVYEAREVGHATLLYGPAEPFVLGWLFKVFPVSNLQPKLLVLGSAIAIIILCLAVLRKYLSNFCLFLVTLSLVAIENRVGYFAEGRPDFVAWLCGFAGLILIYQDSHSKVSYRYLFGLILFVVAVTFKQTAAMLVVVPPIAMIFEGRKTKPIWKPALSFGPALCVTLVFALLYFFEPIYFFYMVEVPRSWPINWEGWLKGMWAFLIGAPCLWYAIALLFSENPVFDPELQRRTLWAFTSLAVTFVAATLTEAKLGGTVNALIPLWFSLATASWFVLSKKLRGMNLIVIENLQWSICLVLFSIALTLTLLPNLQSPLRLIRFYSDYARESNYKYSEIISHVAALNGVIYSPIDPTILLYSKGQASRSIYAELDTIAWTTRIPSYMRAELARADYFIDAAGEHNPVQPQDLSELGFELFWSNGNYGIWRHAPRGIEVPR
jgi:hypothetical protein